MKRSCAFSLICIFVTLFFGITATAGSESNDADSLVIGVPADRCPVFYLDPETKETVGIGVDLMRAAAEEL